MAAIQPYTFGDLKAELRAQLFPQGEADNLIVGHDADFLQALIECQRWCVCQQLNNVELFPQCDTLFKCGLTVIDKPRGVIRRLSVIDKINQGSGLEDLTQLTDWCSEVEYRQVRFEDLDSYMSKALAGTLPFGEFLPWFSGLFGGINLAPFLALPGFWFNKWLFPPPTDAGLGNAPPLPLGYHYGQPSTDIPNGNGRAQFGLWAIKGGQIFVAPWIQSTETILVEWDGIKRTWADTDLVDGEDPTFKKFVLNYVGMEHERKWGHDAGQVQAYASGLNEAQAALIYDCDKENRINNTPDSSAYKARGASFAVPEFFNEAQTATASCPTGQIGTPVTVTVPDNTVISLISVDDANSKAKSQALQQAGQQLQCAPPPVTYSNNPATYTATCGVGGVGTPQTVTIPAGAFTSTISQADADGQALAAATQQATAALSCTYLNDAQSITVTCNSNQQSNTTNIPAGTYSSTLSKADANALAIAAANTANNTWLQANCPGGNLFFNTVQTVCGQILCTTINQQGNSILQTLTTCVTVNAGAFSSATSQQDANQQAQNYGQMRVQAILCIDCHALPGPGNSPNCP